MVNSSLRSGIFPSSEKVARVVPIYKEGMVSDVSNYRPISILPLFSKIYEKVVYRQLYDYLTVNNILSESQFGFRGGVSASNALVSLTRYIYDELDSGNYVFSIFVDFKKAFDCVSHDILLSKLHHYGVRNEAYRFFRSYLSDRHQYVKIGNAESGYRLITHGGIDPRVNLGTIAFFGLYK